MFKPAHLVKSPPQVYNHIIQEQIKEPVDCIILRCKSLSIIEIISILDKIPLIPEGNVWVYLRGPRDSTGSLCLLPEYLTISMIECGWFLADRVHWSTEQTDETRSFLGSCGTWLRFTKIMPKNVKCKMVTNSNIWHRCITENASWYLPFVKCVTEENELVVDANYVNEFVGEAAISLGRKFIGVKNGH